MNGTPLQTSPITLDRHMMLGEIDYQVTAFPTDDHRIELCIVSSDGDGEVVSEISGGISPADLPPLTDVLTSTLAGLIAMTQPPSTVRVPPPPDRRGRFPNQGARWTPEDDDRLVARYREGARPRELMDEFGRSNGGIRARLEYLGELTPGGRWRPPPPAEAAAPQAAAPAAAAPPAVAPAAAPPAVAQPAARAAAVPETIPAIDPPTSPAAGAPASQPPEVEAEAD